MGNGEWGTGNGREMKRLQYAMVGGAAGSFIGPIHRMAVREERADVLEPGRKSRTEINPDGNVNYHIWPDCDVYYKYKNLKNLLNEILRRQRAEHLERIQEEADPFVTAKKHPATSKHKGEF